VRRYAVGVRVSRLRPQEAADSSGQAHGGVRAGRPPVEAGVAARTPAATARAARRPGRTFHRRPAAVGAGMGMEG